MCNRILLIGWNDGDVSAPKGYFEDQILMTWLWGGWVWIIGLFRFVIYLFRNLLGNCADRRAWSRPHEALQACRPANLHFKMPDREACLLIFGI